MQRPRYVMVLAIILCVSPAEAQAPNVAEEEPETKNDVGVFVGGLSNLETDETGPGVGLDYTRELSERFGVGALAEWARAAEREAMFGAALEWKPGAVVKLVLAPAIIVEKEEDDSRSAVFAVRTGIGRTFMVNHVPLTPTLYVDWVDSEDGLQVHLVYGLTIDIPF